MESFSRLGFCWVSHWQPTGFLLGFWRVSSWFIFEIARAATLATIFARGPNSRLRFCDLLIGTQVVPKSIIPNTEISFHNRTQCDLLDLAMRVRYPIQGVIL